METMRLRANGKRIRSLNEEESEKLHSGIFKHEELDIQI
jgi:hypothetical protein